MAVGHSWLPQLTSVADVLVVYFCLACSEPEGPSLKTSSAAHPALSGEDTFQPSQYLQPVAPAVNPAGSSQPSSQQAEAGLQPHKWAFIPCKNRESSSLQACLFHNPSIPFYTLNYVGPLYIFRASFLHPKQKVGQKYTNQKEYRTLKFIEV